MSIYFDCRYDESEKSTSAKSVNNKRQVEQYRAPLKFYHKSSVKSLFNDKGWQLPLWFPLFILLEFQQLVILCPLILRAVCWACVCVVSCATCDRRRLSRWSHLFKLLLVTRSRVQVKRIWVKVTVYLQGCLAYKRCSASGSNCRYLKPYIKLKLIGLAIRIYHQFWKDMNCRIFHDF